MPRFSMPAAALLLTALTTSLPLAAQTAAPLHIDAPYVRLAPPQAQATGAFMQIRNTSDAERKLVKAESPVAKTVELHNHVNENGVMKMRPVTHIVVPAHGKAELKPGSYHVMLIGLKQDLMAGSDITITLTFEHAGEITLTVPVKDATEIGGSGMDGHNMGGMEATPTP